MKQIITPPYRDEIVTDLSWEQYCSVQAVNPSWIVPGLTSMLHFREYQTDTKSTRGMLVGSATHALVFEPENFDKRFAVCPYTRRNGTDKYETWKWQNPGKEALSATEMQEASSIAQAVRRDPVTMDLIGDAHCEVSLFVEDFGVQCKGRVDAISDIRLIDLKCTNSIAPESFGRNFAQMNYGVKMSCYARWLRKLGHDIHEVYIVAVESKPPHDVAVFEVPEELLNNAWPRAERVLKRIPECIEHDDWPGTSEGQILPLVVPNWAMSEEEVIHWS